MITIEQARELKYGQMLHHISQKGSDKQPVRCRITGQVKLWKTRDDFVIPVKHGLYTCFHISNTDGSNEEWEVVS